MIAKHQPIAPGSWLIVFCALANFLWAPGALAQVVTNIGQLHRISDNSRRYSCPIHFQAEVLSADSGSIVLHDDSGEAVFEVDLKSQAFLPGARLMVDAMCLVDGTHFSLKPTPVVNNDGFHATNEQSGGIFLTVGRHPLRAAVFNATQDFVLEVYIEGPGTPRQKIPDSALFRPVSDSLPVQWTNGLNYASYEGEWQWLPPFKTLTPVTKGTVANFDIGVASRHDRVALEFNGFIDISRGGLYTFSTISDDGSSLEIASRPPNLTVIGTNAIPSPRRITPGQLMAEAEDPQWAEVEGIVNFISERSGSLVLELGSGVGRTRVEIADGSGISPIILAKSRIRARGICQTTYTPDGHWIAGLLSVHDRSQIELLSLAHQLWGAIPIVTVTQALNMSFDEASQTSDLAHLSGKLARDQAGIVLVDGSGQLLVEQSQKLPANPDTVVEVIGRLCPGSNVVLQSACWRAMASQSDGAPDQSLVITTVEQVKGMKREDAMLGFPVKVRGVLTIADTGQGVIQDATGGIFFLCDQSPRFQPAVGDYCEIEGVTDPGDFAPIINKASVVRLGTGAMPDPLHPTWDQLMNGSLDTQYVEVQGAVSEARDGAIALLTRGGQVNLGISDAKIDWLKQYENSRVRVRGVLFPSWDKATHRVKFGEILIRNPYLTVDEPAAAEPFSLPSKHVTELQLYDLNASQLRQVKVAGQVVHERNGEIFLMDGTNGFRITPKTAVKLSVGDLVEVVGYPEMNNPSPVLRKALVRKIGHAGLSDPIHLIETNLFTGANDAELVQVEARLLSFSSNRVEQILEVQSGSRTYSARLRSEMGFLPPMRAGSQVRLTGVYSAHGGDRNLGIEIDSFEILLNFTEDVVILSTPPWWTLRHTLAALAVLLTVILLAGQWITQLRRNVEERTRQLLQEVDSHKQTESKLHEKTAALEDEIDERKQMAAQLIEKKDMLEQEIEERTRLEAEKEQIHKELLVASRQAGMAEVATGVLHNVGNVLNSINVSTTFLTERSQNSKCANLAKVAAMLEENASTLPKFLTEDERGRKLPGYLKLLGETLASEQREMQKELHSLSDNVNHVKDIVAMQQSYGRMSAVVEKVAPRELLETAFKMHVGGYLRHEVQLNREFDDVPQVTTDRHKVLQILVNLLQNAKIACDESGRPDKKVTVRLRKVEGTVRIEVADNGIGIPAENMTKIFRHGFTTRKNGHGFGLHSGALAAKELGGSLSVSSEGAGKGATFSLDLPLES